TNTIIAYETPGSRFKRGGGREAAKWPLRSAVRDRRPLTRIGSKKFAPPPHRAVLGRAVAAVSNRGGADLHPLLHVPTYCFPPRLNGKIN
ncbi:unnamed protein product, partial [Nesidiocoris tenuis]